MERTVCDSLAALDAFAASFLTEVQPHPEHASVVGLSGDLGAGKTAFVKALASHLGVSEHVTSPTFVIQKTYQTDGARFRALVHIDAYRLEGGEELVRVGWKDTVALPETLVVIEWPEKVESVLPADAVRLRFETVDETTRAITRT